MTMTPDTLPGAVTEAQSNLLQLVSFRIGREEYAVNVAEVQEIVRLTTITAVPRAPRYVEGVVNLRGRIVPVVDLALRIGLPSQPRTVASRIIITEVRGQTVGMRVDAVSEVLRLDPGRIEPPSDLLRRSLNEECFMGVGKYEDRLIILLDLQRALSNADGRVITAGAEG